MEQPKLNPQEIVDKLREGFQRVERSIQQLEEASRVTQDVLDLEITI